MMHEFAQPTPAMAIVIDETMRPVYDRLRELIVSMLDLSRGHDQVGNNPTLQEGPQCGVERDEPGAIPVRPK